MSIDSKDLRQVLKAHARRISRERALGRRLGSPDDQLPSPVSQSIEVRRQQIMSKIAGDIVAGLARRSHRLIPDMDNPRDIALDRLSQEYGRPLYAEDAPGGGVLLLFSDPDRGGRLIPLPAGEQEVMTRRLAVLEQQVRGSLAP